MTLSEGAKSDLIWWINNVEPAENPISHGDPSMIITSDASGKGWGAVCEKSENPKTGGRW